MKRVVFLKTLSKAGLLAIAGPFLNQIACKVNNIAPVLNGALPAGLFFPADNTAWNTPIPAGLQPDPQSSAILFAQSGGDLTGFVRVECAIPYNVIDTLTGIIPLITIRGKDPGEDDPTTNSFPYMPEMTFQNGPWTADGRDHHLIVVDTGKKLLYEIYQLRQQPDQSWIHEGAAKFDLASNDPRATSYQDSADAAGLPILPGLVRMDEIKRGVIPHALRMTVKTTFPGYIFPATHGTYTSTYALPPTLSPMGARFRLKSRIDPENYNSVRKPIVKCLQTYGAIVADNGTNFAITGSNDVAAYKAVLGGEFYGPDPGMGDDGSFRLLDKNGRDITIGDFELMPMGPISRLP